MDRPFRGSNARKRLAPVELRRYQSYWLHMQLQTDFSDMRYRIDYNIICICNHRTY